jgi:hypothetical protein
MRLTLSSLLIAVGLVSVACGGTLSEPVDALGTQKQALAAIGQGCDTDDECASNFCFRVEDFMPPYTPWEGGGVCTEECSPGTSGDTWCQQLAAQYSAPSPGDARCLTGWDPSSPYQSERSLCDLIPAGLTGSYWSE